MITASCVLRTADAVTFGLMSTERASLADASDTAHEVRSTEGTVITDNDKTRLDLLKDVSCKIGCFALDTGKAAGLTQVELLRVLHYVMETYAQCLSLDAIIDEIDKACAAAMTRNGQGGHS